MKQPPHGHRRTEGGLTLIELLVAMTVGLVVTIAALSMLLLGRTGFTAVDATTQLIDKERFAVDIMSRVIAQAGFEDYSSRALITRAAALKQGIDPEPDIFGWNNTIYADPATAAGVTQTNAMADANRPGKCTVNDTSCLNGSDVLMVRFQGVDGTPTVPDMSMINCMGDGEPAPALASFDNRAMNFFFVARNAVSGEPSLHCAYYDAAATPPNFKNQPLLEGVEAMQVLYGTDNVTPGQTPALPGTDTVADRWLRADQLKVAADPATTRENFRRVRAVRIGLVLRGPPGSAQDRNPVSLTPLGSPTYVATTADVGSELNVAGDGRLRRVVTFTVHIRNELGLK